MYRKKIKILKLKYKKCLKMSKDTKKYKNKKTIRCIGKDQKKKGEIEKLDDKMVHFLITVHKMFKNGFFKACKSRLVFNMGRQHIPEAASRY